jgi:hypothetical protein
VTLVARAFGVLLVAGVALGCGSNAPEIPEELRGGTAGCTAPDYPEQDFGTEPGDVVQNACFRGYRAPERVAAIPEHVETLAFSDFYDPTGSKGVGLLMVNTAAIWCSACISEHRELPTRSEQLGSQGLVILATLFEDAERNPATLSDLERWIDNFGTNFPMVTDPEQQMGAYASPASAPLNLLIDPRTMRILRKYVGDQGDVMWPFIESELALRNRVP